MPGGRRIFTRWASSRSWPLTMLTRGWRKKVGMTQIFKESGEVVPVTVIEAGPKVVTQIKTLEKDGYNAVQVGFEDQKPHRVNKPLTGHFEKSGVTPKKHVAEFRNDEGETYELGQMIIMGLSFR